MNFRLEWNLCTPAFCMVRSPSFPFFLQDLWTLPPKSWVPSLFFIQSNLARWRTLSLLVPKVISGMVVCTAWLALVCSIEPIHRQKQSIAHHERAFLFFAALLQPIFQSSLLLPLGVMISASGISVTVTRPGVTHCLRDNVLL